MANINRASACLFIYSSLIAIIYLSTILFDLEPLESPMKNMISNATRVVAAMGFVVNIFYVL